ncbi:condensation domain-containing protein, partial [Micromonospora sp. NPDC048843]|uniref:condensation domain-containing protein n=1 Tax=Micromonospora sp. NPDC048843 TaxID=3155389 RepID=UPI003404EBF4
DYMVPSVFVVVDELPVTVNGKVDREALPVPEYAVTGGPVPTTAEETLLHRLFAELLGVPAGIDDSFFDLGGDSISSIQLVSRARQAGFVITARDVFTHPTVASLARMARRTEEASASAADGHGDAPLTPVMRMFAEQGLLTDNFCQSVLLEAPADLLYEHLAAAVAAVVERHDMLRARLVVGEVPAEASLHLSRADTIDPSRYVTRIDCSATDDGQLAATVTAETSAARGRLAPRDGDQLQVVWFDRGARPGRVLVLAHHLAVDALSWRILVDDLVAAWRAARAGDPPRLSAVRGSFRHWAHCLQSAAVRGSREVEMPFWESVLKPRANSAEDFAATVPDGTDRSTMRSLRRTLPGHITEAVLTRVPAMFHAGVNDVMLTAFALAVNEWRRRRGRSGQGGDVLVDLESHGRHDIFPDVDLSQVVGWFTSVAPIRLDVSPIAWSKVTSGAPELADRCKQIKEQLRAVPDHGIGFGLLRYLNPCTGARLAQLDAPRMAFNYLGRMTAGGAGDWSLAETPDRRDAVSQPDEDGGVTIPERYCLALSAVALDGPTGPELRTTWYWRPTALDEADVRQLADCWSAALTGLASADGGGRTPSDLSLVSLSQKNIDAIEARWRGLDR